MPENPLLVKASVLFYNSEMATLAYKAKVEQEQEPSHMDRVDQYQRRFDIDENVHHARVAHEREHMSGNNQRNPCNVWVDDMTDRRGNDPPPHDSEELRGDGHAQEQQRDPQHGATWDQDMHGVEEPAPGENLVRPQFFMKANPLGGSGGSL